MIKLDTLKNLGTEKGYELQLTCNFFVVPVEGNRDPGFVINANLANNMLNDGDELIINLKSSKSCYVYMFNLMADNNVMMIYPNKYMEDNHITIDIEKLTTIALEDEPPKDQLLGLFDYAQWHF